MNLSDALIRFFLPLALFRGPLRPSRGRWVPLLQLTMPKRRYHLARPVVGRPALHSSAAKRCLMKMMNPYCLRVVAVQGFPLLPRSVRVGGPPANPMCLTLLGVESGALRHGAFRTPRIISGTRRHLLILNHPMCLLGTTPPSQCAHLLHLLPHPKEVELSHLLHPDLTSFHYTLRSKAFSYSS